MSSEYFSFYIIGVQEYQHTIRKLNHDYYLRAQLTHETILHKNICYRVRAITILHGNNIVGYVPRKYIKKLIPFIDGSLLILQIKKINNIINIKVTPACFYPEEQVDPKINGRKFIPLYPEHNELYLRL